MGGWWTPYSTSGQLIIGIGEQYKAEIRKYSGGCLIYSYLHVRRSLEEILLAILLNDILGVDGQLLVGIHRNQNLANVGLRGRNSMNIQ